jgi:cyclic pyranopterin phosphate synthase
MKKFTHVTDQGKVTMVDVGNKVPQQRRAVARGMISLSDSTLALICENQIKKGDVLAVSQIAGIQAAKQTASLIPLCHPLILDKVDVKLHLTDKGIAAQSEVSMICVRPLTKTCKSVR